MNTATLRIACRDETEATTLQAAIQPDDGHGVSSRVDGTELVIEASSESIMGIVRGLDDVLGCLRATGMD